MAIGRQLTRLLEAKNIAVTTLVADTGIPAATIYSIRRKDSEATNMDALTTLADYLDVPVGYFLRDDAPADEWDADRPRPLRNPLDYKLPSSPSVEDATLSLIGALASRSVALRLTDESMEPQYRKGDAILVDRARRCAPGQAGVFQRGREALFRVLGDGFLLPLNPSFAPVPAREGYECIGAVIGVLSLPRGEEDGANVR